MLVKLKKTLPSFWAKFNLGERKKETALIKSWDNSISKAIGGKFSGQSRILVFEKDLVVIECLNSVWAQEFKFREKKIIQWINQYFGKNKISRIKFVW